MVTEQTTRGCAWVQAVITFSFHSLGEVGSDLDVLQVVLQAIAPFRAVREAVSRALHGRFPVHELLSSA